MASIKRRTKTHTADRPSSEPGGRARPTGPARRSRLPRSPRRRAALVLCAALPALALYPPALSLADLPSTLLNILYVAFGLGTVIFLHELGHFGMAKACDVFVERFSIGFPPTIWSRKWGETEYALGAIPFGGYVKMLGQDDMDPSQLTSEEIAQDPRSYSAKSVWQRMAIISAGVVMNVATAVLFFAAAFGLGLQVHEPVAGGVVAGGPAWKAGLRTGDEIEKINGREANDFLDVIRGVALSNRPIRLEGTRADGTSFDVEVTPDLKGTRREIGLEPGFAPEIAALQGDAPPVMPGTPAAQADPPLKGGDKILAVDGRPVAAFADMLDAFARGRAEPITLDVRRETGPGKPSEVVNVEIGPNKARSFGFRVEFSRIDAVVKGSPADRAGLKAGDRITKVDGQDVGAAVDPVRLPYLFGDRAGETVTLEVLREEGGGPPETREVRIVPEDRPGWTEQPGHPGEPLAIPAIGIAYHLTPRVRDVTPEGPAAKAGLQFGDVIKQVTFVLPPGVKPEPGRRDAKPVEIDLEEKVEGRVLQNYAYIFATMQRLPQRTVKVIVSRSDKLVTAEFAPWSDPADTWFVPTRGFLPKPLTGTLRARSFGHALALGYDSTKNSVTELYLTLRNLLTGDLSLKELRGPLGIAEIAYKVAEQGFAELLRFLGFLSVNLAVLNFLPIPVLDGGHMVFLLWEAVTRRRPSERVVVAATYLGMFFILGLMGTVIYLDLFVHRVFRGEG